MPFIKSFPKLASWQWVLIVIALLVALDWAIRRPDAHARQLNDVLAAQGSQALREYPYPFRVQRVENGTAVMTTPRNVDVPAFRMLGALYPEIDVRNPNDPAFIAVEQKLGQVQGEAAAIVKAQPGIKDVRWELDREWLRGHGIEVPDR